MTTTSTSLTCGCCGQEFRPKRRRTDARFCSMACRSAAHKAGQRNKMTDLEKLARDFTLAHVEIRELIQNDTGKRNFYVELTGPESVHRALAEYCQRQQIDVETYLADVAQELILTAAQEAEESL